MIYRSNCVWELPEGVPVLVVSSRQVDSADPRCYWRWPAPALRTSAAPVQPLLCKAIVVRAAGCPPWFDDMWITAATPMRCGMSRQIATRSDLVGHAGYGYCASRSTAIGAGMPVMWRLATPPSVRVRCSPLSSGTNAISSVTVRFCWQATDLPTGGSSRTSTRWVGACCDRTGKTQPTVTVTSVASVNGSSRSTKP